METQHAEEDELSDHGWEEDEAAERRDRGEARHLGWRTRDGEREEQRGTEEEVARGQHRASCSADLQLAVETADCIGGGRRDHGGGVLARHGGREHHAQPLVLTLKDADDHRFEQRVLVRKTAIDGPWRQSRVLGDARNGGAF